MNKEWSELNKTMQIQLRNKNNFNDGIKTLLILREKLMKQILEFKDNLDNDQFSAIPFINKTGFHNKTIAYSIYHVFRIEDIVAHTIIKKDKQIFFACDYKSRMNSSIITTGNELVKQEIADFSHKLDIDELYNYIIEVDKASTELLKKLTYSDLKIQYSEYDKENVRALGVVSDSPDAVWLTDYWCDKNLKGLIQMPFSRHWIMHVEACLRIQNKICK